MNSGNFFPAAHVLRSISKVKVGSSKRIGMEFIKYLQNNNFGRPQICLPSHNLKIGNPVTGDKYLLTFPELSDLSSIDSSKVIALVNFDLKDLVETVSLSWNVSLCHSLEEVQENTMLFHQSLQKTIGECYVWHSMIDNWINAGASENGILLLGVWNTESTKTIGEVLQLEDFEEFAFSAKIGVRLQITVNRLENHTNNAWVIQVTISN